MKTSFLLGILLVTTAFLQAETAPIERIDPEIAARALADGEQAGVWEQRRSFLHGRIFHSAVWAYPEMIVWGGGSDHQFFNDGGLYNPVTDTWRVVSPTQAPSGRWAHAAVWTGREMIIWGGRSSFAASDHHRDGALYNPDTNTWRPMTTENAPEGRSQMAAVWTGEEMIVWGGIGDGGENFNSGARYNPTTATWTPLPLEHAPEARMEPAFVWTGHELIVWGGLLDNGTRSCGTGARYSPQTNSWTPLPTEGAPTSSRGLKAIWTGSEMIVWGGSHLSEGDTINIGLKTGGHYNPDNNTWQPTTLENAPAGRMYHTAIWSGQEMIVWGGGDQQQGNFATGGRYHPTTHQWTPTANTNAPTGRGIAIAVWTGEGLLIYGGSTGGTAAFNETYYYRPNRPSVAPHPAAEK